MASLRNPFEPMMASLKVMPPAISGGLMVFMTILFFVGVAVPGFNDSLKLQKSTFSNFELNRLTFYPMLHLSLLHLGLNCWALLPLLSAFELQNGTVRTGIVLNALGTVTGVLYILCSFVFFPNGSVLGSSAWVFSFLAYFSYLESKYSPSTTLAFNVRIPTVSKPIILLIITAVLVPGSSIIGHSLGVIAGWLLAMGKLRFMTDPPSKVVLFIESKISPLINLIPRQIRYITEIDGIELRKTNHHAPSVLPMTEIPVSNRSSNNGSNPIGGATITNSVNTVPPKTNQSNSQIQPPAPSFSANENSFKGEGSVLGERSEQELKNVEEQV